MDGVGIMFKPEVEQDYRMGVMAIPRVLLLWANSIWEVPTVPNT
jgi:hypothetical protein